MKIILASSSPRRREILQKIFNNIIIEPPSVEERILPNDLPLQFCQRISKEKAESVASRMTKYDSFLIISCDTIVTIGNQIIGKPISFNDAANKIRILNGKKHKVISSITLLFMENGKIEKKTGTESSSVIFKTLTNMEITDYLNKIDFSDKAGAYAVQEYGNLIINSIHGSQTNIIGFPLRLFYSMLSQMNLHYKILLSA